MSMSYIYDTQLPEIAWLSSIDKMGPINKFSKNGQLNYVWISEYTSMHQCILYIRTFIAQGYSYMDG